MRGTLKSTKSMKELKRYNNKNMRNITVHVFFFPNLKHMKVVQCTQQLCNTFTCNVEKVEG